MEIRRIKVHIVLISFILMLILGIAARSFFHTTRVVEPLQRSIEAVPGVSQVTLVQSGHGQAVRIALKEDARLAETLPAVQQILQAYGGHFALEILDNPTFKAREALRRMMFVVEEAVAQGGFQVMEEEISEIAREFGQELILAMDRSYIYLQLNDTEGCLRRVTSRGSADTVRTVAGTEVGS